MQVKLLENKQLRQVVRDLAVSDDPRISVAHALRLSRPSAQ
jgi:hypothetical protein